MGLRVGWGGLGSLLSFGRWVILGSVLYLHLVLVLPDYKLLKLRLPIKTASGMLVTQIEPTHQNCMAIPLMVWESHSNT